MRIRTAESLLQNESMQHELVKRVDSECLIDDKVTVTSLRVKKRKETGFTTSEIHALEPTIWENVRTGCTLLNVYES